MGAAVGGERASPSVRTVPTTGMRGGLGRTLLTAFLILTILPLAFVGWYALRQNRMNLEREVTRKLQAVAKLKAEEFELWLSNRGTLLSLVNSLSAERLPTTSSWEALQQERPELVGARLSDVDTDPLWTLGGCEATPLPLIDLSSLASDNGVVALAFPLSGDRTLTLCLRSLQALQTPAELSVLGETGHVYLVQPGAPTIPQSEALTALARGESGAALYVNHAEKPVVGAYCRSGLGVGILVEQEQAEALASTDQIAATFIAVILASALATTVISAMVIRQITSPVVRLTESALDMSEGELDQHLEVTSRDEIGILTYVFNEMAAELKSLYDELEAKVIERTKRLQKANYQIQWRALQLEASLAVSEAVTSLRDPTELLNRVVDLICERFLYDSAAVYLVEPGGGRAHRQAVSPAQAAGPEIVSLGDGSFIERALRKAKPQVVREELPAEETWYNRTLVRIAVPLRMEERVLGALTIVSTERTDMVESNMEVLVHLANQIAIALENARAYERERRAAEQLADAEAFKSRFLANMSHTLREPLNSIIGFSRLMLKGIDGPLSEQQTQDLERIHSNSRRLLTLINDILTISQIQAGLMALKLEPVSLVEIIESVKPTAEALIRGKEIALEQETEPDLPLVSADPVRIRQVLVRMLSNAAKFTQRGHITVRAWSDEEYAYVSVEDTGIGVPEAERERIFARFEKGSETNGASGVGLGLALSKEFVEMHGGQMWLDSEVGEGSTFTFSLPLYSMTTGTPV